MDTPLVHDADPELDLVMFVVWEYGADTALGRENVASAFHVFSGRFSGSVAYCWNDLLKFCKNCFQGQTRAEIS